MKSKFVKKSSLNIDSDSAKKLDDLVTHFIEDVGIKDLTQLNELSVAIKKRAVEAMLKGEMSAHLKQEKEQGDIESLEAAVSYSKNKRNGSSSKKVITANDETIELNIPRDRNGTYEPIIVPRHSRRLEGFDEKIIQLYARGLSTRDISDFIEEQYGFPVSASTISEITDAVLQDIREWQDRPLDCGYPVIFFDAIRTKIRNGGKIIPKAVYIAFAITAEGKRDVLGLWIEENESASFWRSVLTNLQNRGVKDIILAVSDGLKGMTQAIEATFPQALHQTCIVHLIRSSTKMVAYKDRQLVCDALKAIYQATDAESAEMALEEFEENPIAQRYPAIANAWRSAWPQVIPFFSYSPQLRKLVYTTNCIEGLNRCIRKVTKTRASFPTDDAAKKLIWLAMKSATKDWSRNVREWSKVKQELLCLYGDRMLVMLKEYE